MEPETRPPPLPPPPPNASLAARAIAAIGQARPRLPQIQFDRTARRWPGVALAALIAAAPLLTIAGAVGLAAAARADAARLSERAAPRIAAERAQARAAAVLRALAQRPTLGATVEALARVLPPDASVVRAGRRGDGALELAIAAPDPDQVRAALARAPEFAALRNTGQRRADAGMLVTFAGGGQ